MVGGERDVTYADIDYNLPRATEEGEQMQVLMEQPEDIVPERVVLEEPPQVGRPAGKLFGKSLIDDLEQRKAIMRNKQRVFRGDDRPSMMARGQLKRSSTLIDPESLQQPISQHQDSFRSQPLDRRNSANAKPLLNFDDNKPGSKATLSPNPRAQNGRSVFGTDTLWEREMRKLKEIEAQEKLEREATEKREAEEAAREEGKKKKSKGSKAKAKIQSQDEEKARDSETTPYVSVAPPTLPAISKSTARGPPPPVNDDDTESDSDDSMRHSLVQHKVRRGSAETAADRWVTTGSTDEEDNGPRRTTGVGPRYPTQHRGQYQPTDDDSEEDLPLAATVERALQRVKPSSRDESDEDQPLSVMLDKAKSILPINFDSLAVGNPSDEEDDQPLGLRMSRMPPSSHALGSYAGDDDDDKPLAFHPDQQRRTQYQVMAQQQHMMMQAQMQQSMFFGAPSMMGSGFFNPSMTMPAQMMAVPQMLPQHLSLQPPADDPGKFGRVDRWRHDVAVEGPPAV